MTDIMASPVDWLLKLTLLLAGALGLAPLLRRSAAAIRYRMWIATLALAFAGPVLARWLEMPLPILPEVSSTPAGAGPLPADSPEFTPGATGATALSRPRILSDASAPAPFQTVLVLWAAIAFALGAHLALSSAKVRRLIAAGRKPTDPRWQALLDETADRMKLDQAPALLISEGTRLPVACRVHRPVIVLPPAANDWTEERRRVVLLHEMAHIKRRDLLGHTLSRLACAVYWFHPLVWLGAKRLRAESERACDDLALASGAKPTDYAQELLTMVAELRSEAGAPTAMAMAANREFEGRIISILDPTLPRQSPSSVRAGLPAVTILAFGFGLAVMHPTARAVGTSPQQTPPQSTIGVSSGDTAILRQVEIDSSAEVRRVAAWALHEKPGSAPALVTTLNRDPDAAVREMAAWALGQQGDSAALPALYSRLRSETDDAVRATLAWAIGQLRGREHAQLLPLLRSANPNVVLMALWAIGQNPPRPVPRAVLAHLDHPDRNVRHMAAWSLGEAGDAAAVPQLLEALNSEQDSGVRRPIFRALFESGDHSPALIQAAQRSTDPDVRVRAVLITAGQKPSPWTWPLPLPDPRPVP